MAVETYTPEVANASFLEKIAQNDQELFVEGHAGGGLAEEALSQVNTTHTVVELMKSPENNIARKHFLKGANDSMHDLLDYASQAATLLEFAITSEDGSNVPASEWHSYVSNPDADPDVVDDIKAVLKFRQDIIGRGVNTRNLVDTRGLSSGELGAWMNEVDEYALWKGSSGKPGSAEGHLSTLATLAKESAKVGTLLGERLNGRLMEYKQGLDPESVLSVAESGSGEGSFGRAREIAAKCVVGGIKTGRMGAGVAFLDESVAARAANEEDRSGTGRKIPGPDTTLRVPMSHRTGAAGGRSKQGPREFDERPFRPRR